MIKRIIMGMQCEVKSIVVSVSNVFKIVSKKCQVLLSLNNNIEKTFKPKDIFKISVLSFISSFLISYGISMIILNKK